jgi:hypothetical protein
MEPFTKIVRLGTCKTPRGRAYSVFCKIQYSAGPKPRLSITGVEGPTRAGNALGAGQIVRRLKASHFSSFAPGWDFATVQKFLDLWELWHLNDMQAGTPKQTEALEEFYATRSYPDNGYTQACEYLESKGLLYDAHPETGEPYKYGSGWLYKAVPDDVLEFFRGLPDTDRQPAWV